MVVATGTALFATAALAACGGSEPEKDHQGVCVDQTTQKRVDDDKCDDEGGSSYHGGGFYAWRLFPRGSAFPAIGKSVTGGISSIPSGHGAVYGGGDAAGGTVTKQSTTTAMERGGFGKTSRGSSGSVGG
ncbi:hypothetical protein JCM9957A_08060 [Kineosporia succinea]